MTIRQKRSQASGWHAKRPDMQFHLCFTGQTGPWAENTTVFAPNFGGSQGAPGRAPRGLQEASLQPCPQEAPKRYHMSSLDAPRRSKTPPRRSQDAPRRSKTPPRRPQDGPLGPSWGHLGHLEPSDIPRRCHLARNRARWPVRGRSPTEISIISSSSNRARSIKILLILIVMALLS